MQAAVMEETNSDPRHFQGAAVAWVSIAMLHELLAALRGEVSQTQRERLDAEIEYVIAVAGERTWSL